jgi:hypothetical protein
MQALLLACVPPTVQTPGSPLELAPNPATAPAAPGLDLLRSLVGVLGAGETPGGTGLRPQQVTALRAVCDLVAALLALHTPPPDQSSGGGASGISANEGVGRDTGALPSPELPAPVPGRASSPERSVASSAPATRPAQDAPDLHDAMFKEAHAVHQLPSAWAAADILVGGTHEVSIIWPPDYHLGAPLVDLLPPTANRKPVTECIPPMRAFLPTPGKWGGARLAAFGDAPATRSHYPGASVQPLLSSRPSLSQVQPLHPASPLVGGEGEYSSCSEGAMPRSAVSTGVAAASQSAAGAASLHHSFQPVLTASTPTAAVPTAEAAHTATTTPPHLVESSTGSPRASGVPEVSMDRGLLNEGVSVNAAPVLAEPMQQGIWDSEATKPAASWGLGRETSASGLPPWSTLPPSSWLPGAQQSLLRASTASTQPAGHLGSEPSAGGLEDGDAGARGIPRTLPYEARLAARPASMTREGSMRRTEGAGHHPVAARPLYLTSTLWAEGSGTSLRPHSRSTSRAQSPPAPPVLLGDEMPLSSRTLWSSLRTEVPVAREHQPTARLPPAPGHESASLEPLLSGVGRALLADIRAELRERLGASPAARTQSTQPSSHTLSSIPGWRASLGLGPGKTSPPAHATWRSMWTTPSHLTGVTTGPPPAASPVTGGFWREGSENRSDVGAQHCQTSAWQFYSGTNHAAAPAGARHQPGVAHRVLTDLTNLAMGVGGTTDALELWDLPPIPSSLKHGLPTAYATSSLDATHLQLSNQPAGHPLMAPGHSSRHHHHADTVQLPVITELPGAEAHISEMHPYLTYRFTADNYSSHEADDCLLNSHVEGVHDALTDHVYMSGLSYQQEEEVETQDSTCW